MLDSASKESAYGRSGFQKGLFCGTNPRVDVVFGAAVSEGVASDAASDNFAGDVDSGVESGNDVPAEFIRRTSVATRDFEDAIGILSSINVLSSLSVSKI